MKKKYMLIVFLLLSIIVFQTVSVGAAEIEWYELKEEDFQLSDIQNENEEVSLYTLYIGGATLSLKKLDSGKLGMRSEVFCSETMKKIETTFKLQRKAGGSWATVGTGTVSESNSRTMYKSMSASNPASGTYRCIATTKVTSYSGYSETVTITSASITI